MALNSAAEHKDFLGLLNQLKVGILRFGANAPRRVLFANLALQRMLGYRPEDLENICADDIFADAEQMQTLLTMVRQQGKAVKQELRLKTQARGELLCAVAIMAVGQNPATVDIFDAVIEDVAGSKQTEQDLQESKELFQTVFNNSAVAIIVIDQDDRIVAWNPFTEKLLAYDKNDLFNKPIRELYSPQEWERIACSRTNGQGGVADFETQVLKKDQTSLSVNISTSLIKDSDRRGVSSIMIVQDLTKQKMTEQRIKESENKIRIILDNSAAAIMLTDEQERIISWNRYTEQMLGYQKNELYLRPVSGIYPAEEWQKIREMNIRKLGSKHHLETRVVRKDGQMIDIDLSVNILKDTDSKIIGSVGIMQDITEQKRMQQMLVQAKIAAEEASSAKSLFLANMSHEVRTPMNTIIGMIDLTLDSQLTDEQRENLRTVKDAADILLSLLNDILDLSRVEAGKIQLESIELNVPNIVKSVCKGLSVLAHQKNLDIVWDIDSNIQETLVGDPVRIRQVLVNLINNAIKFTFRENIVVGAKIQTSTPTHCELLFFVKDQGIGIPQGKLETIFDVFTQADASTTRRFGGTGLGLSISKRLVEMMGGRIWVESEEYKGSTFYFTAMLKYVGKETVVPTPTPTVEEVAVSPGTSVVEVKPLTILLAEDNIVNQKMAVKMLEKRGWTVKAANNGKQVLEMLDDGAFDLILMDAQMPVLDGFETTKLIRENEKKTGRHIPIIALTARAMTGDRRRCLDCGMDGYVSKPIDRQNLYDTIEKFT
jgi:PAS domain S-box-containing protein